MFRLCFLRLHQPVDTTCCYGYDPIILQNVVNNWLHSLSLESKKISRDLDSRLGEIATVAKCNVNVRHHDVIWLKVCYKTLAAGFSIKIENLTRGNIRLFKTDAINQKYLHQKRDKLCTSFMCISLSSKIIRWISLLNICYTICKMKYLSFWMWLSLPDQHCQYCYVKHCGLFFNFLIYLFKKNLEDISPFCGTMDTPVSDFWWRFLRVSKPEWASLFTLGGGTCVTCSLRFTSGVTPADLLTANMIVELISSTYLWAGIGGAQNQDLPTELCWLSLLCGIFIGYNHFWPCWNFCPVIRTENTGKLKSHFSIYCQEDFSQVSCIKNSYVSIQWWLQSDDKICVTRIRYDLLDLWC